MDELLEREPSVEELEELGAFDADEELDAAADSFVEERIGEWRLARSSVKLALGITWGEYEATKRSAWAGGVRAFPREYEEAEAAVEHATEASLAAGDADREPRERAADAAGALEAARTALKVAMPALRRATQVATPVAAASVRHLPALSQSRRTGTRARSPRPVRRAARTAASRGDPSEPDPPSAQLALDEPEDDLSFGDWMLSLPARGQAPGRGNRGCSSIPGAQAPDCAPTTADTRA